MFLNVYNSSFMVLKASQGGYEGLIVIIFVILIGSASIAFHSALGALGLILHGRSKKNDQLLQEEADEEEQPNNRYRMFYIIGFVLLIPMFFWLLGLIYFFILI